MGRLAGNLELALASTILTLLVLLLFSLLERYIDKVHHDKLYVIVFTTEDYENLLSLEKSIADHHLRSIRRQISKRDGCLHTALLVTGHKKHITKLDEKLLSMHLVKSF